MSEFLEMNDFLQFMESELLLNAGELNAQTVFRELNAWSSLNALIFISRLNEEHDILIGASDLAKCTTLFDLHQLVIQK